MLAATFNITPLKRPAEKNALAAFENDGDVGSRIKNAAHSRHFVGRPTY
jgi:hypothetical protein